MSRRTSWPMSVIAALGMAAVVGCGDKITTANLVVPSGNKVAFKAYGDGDQVYTSAPSSNDPNVLEWKFKAPEAMLRSSHGAFLGVHYLGPTWVIRDSSKVVGKLVAQAASPDPTAVPWLLLQATSPVTPHGGNGKLSNVTYIQRVDTAGGKAPATAPIQAGTEMRVHYTATYYFYIAQ